MAKMTGGKAAKMGFKSKSVGNMTDGARLSKKGQTTALLPKNKIKGAMTGSAPKARMARMTKMEDMDSDV